MVEVVLAAFFRVDNFAAGFVTDSYILPAGLSV